MASMINAAIIKYLPSSHEVDELLRWTIMDFLRISNDFVRR